MPTQEGAMPKVCAICRKDATDRPRLKDQQGRYYHKDCYEAAKQKLSRRQTGAPTASKPAAPSRAAAPAPRPPLTRVAEPAPATLDLLDQLSSLESSAPAVASSAACQCPSCGAGVPAGAAICTACGLNLKTGQRMAIATAAAVPVARAAKKAGREKSAGGSSDKPWLWGAIPLLLLMILFSWAKRDHSMFAAYAGAYALYGLAVGVWVLVRAFGDSAVSGVLCIFLPFYSIYFVLVKNDDSRLKFCYLAGLIAGALYVVLIMMIAASNPNLMLPGGAEFEP